jgi:predicted aspartyl protease
MKTKRRKNMGRFSVEFEVSNYQDEVAARLGTLNPTQIRRARISGVVDSGASELVLPEKVVEELGFPKAPKIKVKYADGRRATRDLVDDVRLELLGRKGTFQAIVEPRRKDALIGAIVLEVLDFLPDCKYQRLVPRDPKFKLAEVE